MVLGAGNGAGNGSRSDGLEVRSGGQEIAGRNETGGYDATISTARDKGGAQGVGDSFTEVSRSEFTQLRHLQQ